MMYHHIISFIILLALTPLGTGIENTTTPTPAPSKTPTPDTATQSVSDTDELQSEVPNFIQPFTQSDLSVLTGNVQRPNGAQWHDDKIYIVCNGDWTIYELQDTTGSTRTYIYGVRNSHTMYIEDISDTDINIWVPDYDTNSLLLVNRIRSPQTIASSLQGPWGIAYVDEENFLITNLAGNNVVLVNRNGEVRELVSQMRSPTGIASNDAYVYVANNGSARRSIEWFETQDLLEGENPSPQPLVSGLQNTTGLVMGNDGLLYFTYALGTRGVVGRVDPAVCQEQGGCSNDQVEIVIYTDLAAPLAGLTISPDMRLFIHTIFRPEIYWVQLEQRE